MGANVGAGLCARPNTVLRHCVANNIFICKENRGKLLGHKIASSTHKIAPAAHKIPAPPWMPQKWLRNLDV